MQTALCLSGHLRSFESTYLSLRKFIIEPLNADVFIHTWETIGISRRIDAKTTRVLTNQVLDKIHTCYNPKQIIVELLDRSRGLKYNKYLVDGRNAVAVTSMFYKIYKADELRHNCPTKYDLIIRARPDLLFHSQIDPEHIKQALNEDCLFLPDCGHFSGFNDQFAFGSSNAMKIYANCYNELDKWVTEVPFIPETLLKHHVLKNNVSIKFAPIPYKLARANGSIFDNKFHSPEPPTLLE